MTLLQTHYYTILSTTKIWMIEVEIEETEHDTMVLEHTQIE